MPNSPPNQSDGPTRSRVRSRVVRRILGALSAIGLVAYVASGTYIVQPDERAVVRRFGGIVARNVRPGIHWAFPWPIDQVDKPRTTEVRRVIVGLAPEEADEIRLGNIAAITRALETDVLTGDENILKSTMVVQYQISDAAQFLFGTANPNELVRMTVAAVFADLIGGLTVDDALTVGKTLLQSQTLIRAQQRLDEYGCGVSLLSTDLTDVSPPLAVLDSFNDVASAKKDRERSRDQAVAFRNTILPQARGAAAQRVQQAEAYKLRRVNHATGQADRFVAKYEAYRENPVVTRDRIRLEYFERILPRMRTYILDGNPDEPVTRLRLVE